MTIFYSERTSHTIIWRKQKWGKKINRKPQRENQSHVFYIIRRKLWRHVNGW